MHFTLKKRLHRFFVIQTIFLLSVGGAIPVPAQADTAEIPLTTPIVIIEEIAWAGSVTSAADEWIELANIGNATATIAGWSVKGIAPLPVFLPEGAEISPGGTYRIANYAETDEKSALAVSVQLATTTVAISNTALGVSLVDTTGAVMDRAGNGAAPFAGTSSPRATMMRIAETAGDFPVTWITATSSAGFKETISDFGAPGLCFICTSTSTDSDPWPDAESLIHETDGEIVTTNVSSTLSNANDTSTTSSTTSNVTTATSTTSAQTTTEANTSSSTAASQQSSTEITVVTPHPPLSFSLSEVLSNPAAGPEWIEVRVTDLSATATDRTLELWDASGRISTVLAHTPFTAPGYLLVTLASARLNNGGDDLSVRETSGIVLQFIHIPALEDGEAWARADTGAWLKTTTLTPSGPNQFPTATSVSQTTEVTRTSGTVSQSVATSTVSSSLNKNDAESVSSLSLLPLLTVHLNEVLSNPETGSEWVELRFADTQATATDRTLELWDAAGRISTIPAHTPFTAPEYLVVTLASARLNNGGDDLSLRNAGSDIILESTVIPSLARGITWARTDAGEWTDTDQPTPGSLNIVSLAEEATSTDDDTSSSVKTSSTTSKSKTMPTESLTSARVRLVGTVGSVPRLLGATHAFILLGEDGRAAITYLPKHLNTPPLGSTVRVMGTLTATERQMELRMKSTDVWMTIATSTPPHPRVMDFLAPGTDDAWGLVAATGTVTNVSATRVLMDVDAIEVAVSIPAISGYRAKRLTIGDTINVTGLFDPRKEAPTILIRVPEDILLTAHAPSTVTTPEEPAKKSIPDWSPFGAAAGAVAVTGGIQRLRTYTKRRKLAAMATATP